MRRVSLLISFVILSLFPAFLVSAQDQDSGEVEITSQTAGQAVRGIVPVSGNTSVDGFISWELTFGYANDTTGTWFLFAEGQEPVTGKVLTEWDTTTITDGLYNLRLTVYLEGGRRIHFILPDIRVRNYTPIETETPTPTLTTTPYTQTLSPIRTPTITEPPTETPIPDTPTPLPTNPVEISAQDVSISLTRGASIVLTVFLIIGLYTSVRKWLAKH